MPKPKKPTFTLQRARELLHYEPDTGHFYRRTNRRCRHGPTSKGAGDRADLPGHQFYLRVGIDGERVFAHRLAWFMYHGRWPTKGIDHVNGNRHDNRISNLRQATQLQQMHNRRGKTKDLPMGVFHGPKNKTKPYYSQIIHGGRRYCLGTFATPEEAREAWLAKARELRGNIIDALAARC